jgi:hypothetical protein
MKPTLYFNEIISRGAISLVDMMTKVMTIKDKEKQLQQIEKIEGLLLVNDVAEELAKMNKGLIEKTDALQKRNLELVKEIELLEDRLKFYETEL